MERNRVADDVTRRVRCAGVAAWLVVGTLSGADRARAGTCTMEAEPCDDGIFCTIDDRCNDALLCMGTPAHRLCTDGNACTEEICDPGAGCVPLGPVPSGVPCDVDADPCTDDSCDGAGACAPGPPLPDFDSDGVCDAVDGDDDNDGVPDGMDVDPFNPDLCTDSDADTCDDCSVGTDGTDPMPDNDPFNDGPDADGDGLCDDGDPCPTTAGLPGDSDSDGTPDGGETPACLCDAACVPVELMSFEISE